MDTLNTLSALTAKLAAFERSSAEEDWKGVLGTSQRLSSSLASIRLEERTHSHWGNQSQQPLSKWEFREREIAEWRATQRVSTPPLLPKRPLSSSSTDVGDSYPEPKTPPKRAALKPLVPLSSTAARKGSVDGKKPAQTKKAAKTKKKGPAKHGPKPEHGVVKLQPLTSQAALASKHQEANEKVAECHVQTRKAMLAAEAILPMDLRMRLTMSRRLMEYKMKNGMQLVQKFMHQLLYEKKEWGIQQWRKGVEAVKWQERHDAAKLIQQNYRIILTRRYMEQIRKATILRKKHLQRKLRVAVRVAEMLWRKFVAAKAVILERNRQNGAAAMQRAYRAYRVRLMFEAMCSYGRRVRGLAASRIQTIGRRRTAKAFVKELRSQLFLLVRLHRIEVKKKERAARAEIIQLRLQQNGAAAQIQIRWRGQKRLKTFRKLMRRRRELFARKIQKMWRKKQLEKWKRDRRRRSSLSTAMPHATIINRTIKGYLARRFYRSKKALAAYRKGWKRLDLPPRWGYGWDMNKPSMYPPWEKGQRLEIGLRGKQLAAHGEVVNTYLYRQFGPPLWLVEMGFLKIPREEARYWRRKYDAWKEATLERRKQARYERAMRRLAASSNTAADLSEADADERDRDTLMAVEEAKRDAEEDGEGIQFPSPRQPLIGRVVYDSSEDEEAKEYELEQQRIARRKAKRSRMNKKKMLMNRFYKFKPRTAKQKNRAAARVQKCWRRFVELRQQHERIQMLLKRRRKKQYQWALQGTLRCQACWRGYITRQWYFRQRYRSEATCIQRAWRRFMRRKLMDKFRILRHHVIAIQKYYRGYAVRIRFRGEIERRLFFRQFSVLLQRVWRGYNVRRKQQYWRERARRWAEEAVRGRIDYAHSLQHVSDAIVLSGVYGFKTLGNVGSGVGFTLQLAMDRATRQAGIDEKRKDARNVTSAIFGKASLLKAGEKPVSPILKARSISPSRLEETGEGELENADSSEWRARFRKRDQPAALDLNELLEEKNEGGTKGPGPKKVAARAIDPSTMPGGMVRSVFEDLLPYATRISNNPNRQIAPTAIVKLLRLSPGLLGAWLPPSKIDTLILSSRPGDDKKYSKYVDFRHFQRLLQAIADERFRFQGFLLQRPPWRETTHSQSPEATEATEEEPPEVKAGEGSQPPSSVEGKGPSASGEQRGVASGQEASEAQPQQETKQEEKEEFYYHRWRGQFARVLHLLLDHIFQCPLGPKALKPLQQQVDLVIDSAARTLQHYLVKAPLKAKAAHAEMDLLKALREQRRTGLRIAKFQAVWRGRVERDNAARRAVGVYLKFRDADSGKLYYYNSRTGVVSWEKPALLRTFDVQDIIVVPPREEMYVVYCDVCGDAAKADLAKKQTFATRHCNICRTNYCDACDEKYHSGGDARDFTAHKRSPIYVCTLCNYQTAAVQLPDLRKLGKEFMCHVCYISVRERYPRGVVKGLVLPCERCEERSAEWECEKCEEVYCTKCYKKRHSRSKFQYHVPRYMPYFTHAAQLESEQESRLAAYKRNKHKIIEEMHEEWVELRELSALKIVKAWRRYIFRRRLVNTSEAIQKAQRLASRKAWLRKKEDSEVRSTFKYKAKKAIGLNLPVLESDTPMEKADKLSGPEWKKRVKRMLRIRERRVPDWCELYGSVRITKGVFQGYLGTVMSIAKTPLTGYVSVLVSGEPKKQQIKLKHLGQIFRYKSKARRRKEKEEKAKALAAQLAEAKEDMKKKLKELKKAKLEEEMKEFEPKRWDEFELKQNGNSLTAGAATKVDFSLRDESVPLPFAGLFNNDAEEQLKRELRTRLPYQQKK